MRKGVWTYIQADFPTMVLLGIFYPPSRFFDWVLFDFTEVWHPYAHFTRVVWRQFRSESIYFQLAFGAAKQIANGTKTMLRYNNYNSSKWLVRALESGSQILQVLLRGNWRWIAWRLFLWLGIQPASWALDLTILHVCWLDRKKNRVSLFFPLQCC